MKFGVGQSVTRKEDPRLLKGEGLFVDDLRLEGRAVGYVLRSPVAHGRIAAMNLAQAREAEGVVLVWAAEDADATGLKDLRTAMPTHNSDGSKGAYPTWPHLARGVVRYVGQPVAFVVAETLEQARDAAEMIDVEYEESPVVTDGAAALGEGAPQLHPEAPHNRAYDWAIGDAEAVETAFRGAAHVTRLRVVNPRIVVNAMEPRAIDAAWNADDGRWDIWCATQGSHSMRGQIAGVLGVEPQALRVRTPDVGGGFGMKLMLHPEYGLACAAAKALGRPVKWTADRSESFLGDLQGRDLTTEAEAATDAEGRIKAIRLSSISNLGAYASRAGPSVHTAFAADLACTVYDVPAAHNRICGVYTNTSPVDAYRGAGRPEQNYIMERLLDRVGADLGIAQDEIRRRNFAQPEQMPWTSVLGVTLDSGDFPALLEQALENADVAGFEARREASASRGKLRGLGLAFYMERTGGGPVESARIRVIPGSDAAPDRVLIWAGTQSTGQGHETGFAQLVHETLGVAFESIEWVAGDSDNLSVGGGTGGSRSLIMAGSSFLKAADDVIVKALPGAAEALEAAEADVEFSAAEGGLFRVAGTDRTVTLFEAAAASGSPEVGVMGEGGINERSGSFPNGCHICEVEIDADTAELTLQSYHVVDDFGRILNPLLVRGQVIGGIGQGVGEALGEVVRHDPDSGQPLSASYMDYRMPRAADMPAVEVAFRPTECAANPLGVKGCGEAGSVGAGPCVMIGALDALRRACGVQELDMPATQDAIWRAMRTARRARAAE